MTGQKFLVEMPYIGGVLSKNSYKFNNRWRTTKPIVKNWMSVLADKVSLLEIPKASGYQIIIQGQFKDNRYPDIHNLHEVIADSLQRSLGVKDKFFRFHDGEVLIVPSEDPKIKIEIIPLYNMGMD